jgi:hypothetical protein
MVTKLESLVEPNDIARTQLQRFRRRLGTLTPDQELQIENLLISTAAKISAMVTSKMLKLSRTVNVIDQGRG